MSLARRSITSVTWTTIANLLKLPIGFVQSIVLARYLPIEYFGIYTGMMAVVVLSEVPFNFGLSDAFVHRAPETADEKGAIDVFFSLKFIFRSIWLILMITSAFLFTKDMRRMVLIVLAVFNYLRLLVDPPASVLRRRVQYQRLAFLNLTLALIVVSVTIPVAVLTGSIWSLMITPIVSLIWSLVIMYAWKPVWRPRFAWDLSVVKYYLNFGARSVVGKTLNVALEHLDDLWTNLYLGDLFLGYYSRAYKFATYPRLVLAEPVNAVASATYAELKYDRQRLSKAFTLVNTLLIRSGFFLAGWLSVIAPYFIRLFIGERWLPMLGAFRLMLIFTLLDPLKVTVGSALVAVGLPEKTSQTRVVQVIALLVGLFVLGSRLDIAGVALAVDIMAVIGIGLLLYFLRPHVDYSLPRLFVVPAVALIVGISLSWVASSLWDLSASDWGTLTLKSVAFGLGYAGVLLGLEGRSLRASVREILALAGFNEGTFVESITQMDQTP